MAQTVLPKKSKSGSATDRRSREFQTRLNQIYERLSDAENLESVLSELREELPDLLHCDRVTIYERTLDGREIVSIFLSAQDLEEIRLPMSPTSIAGYVAMSQKPVRIADVYDADQLTAIHARLRFDYNYDQASGFLTRSIMTVPICLGDTLMGVLQAINRIGVPAFSEEDMILAQELASAVGQKMSLDRESTEGPYDYLVEQGKLTREQLAQIEHQTAAGRGSVPALLESELGITNAEIGASLAQYYQVPYMGHDANVQLPDELIESLNPSFLIRNFWVPVAGDRDKVVILIDNPNDAERIMDIQKILNANSYEFLVGLRSDILQYLGVEREEIVADIEAPEVQLEELVGRLDDERAAHDDEIGAPGELIDENAATVVQLVNKLIADAVEFQASDIHVEPGKGREHAVVRMRVDGVCRRVLQIPASHIRYVVARIKIMSKIDIAENRLPQDGKIACRLHGQPLELRVATVPTVNGQSVVLRVLSAGDPMPFEELDLSPRNIPVVRRMIEHPHGIVLVVGPTGSGKTTTLHAILALINTPERKILTAEDPVEITQPGLQQLQVRSNIGLDFARALRSFLRADPDVILIGEIRDFETAHSSIQASLTGHLVFSTLHTNSAPETVTRLLDMGLEPLNFSDALVGVVAQRLVRTLCSKCKEAYTPDQEELDRIIVAYGKEFFPELGVDTANCRLYRPAGCAECGGTGYRGRTGVHEVLSATQSMKDLIIQGPGATEIRKLAFKEGMRTLMQDGITKIFTGKTDLYQVRAITIG